MRQQAGASELTQAKSAAVERAFFCWVDLRLNHDQVSAHCGKNQDVIEATIYSYSTGLINP